MKSQFHGIIVAALADGPRGKINPNLWPFLDSPLPSIRGGSGPRTLKPAPRALSVRNF